MRLADWFRTFCGNIQVQDGGTISSRYRTITWRLNTDFWGTYSETSHSLYVGSYGRNTATQGFSDLDMIFQLPYVGCTFNITITVGMDSLHSYKL